MNYIRDVHKRKLWKKSKIPRDRRIQMKKRCELCKKLSRVSEIRHRAKIENKLTKLEKDILLSFENERNLNESLFCLCNKIESQILLYLCEKTIRKLKQKLVH